mmetsp:Transcript_15210/g.18450  ORF Transcript_15210/g.18450 Transcript_15210/m.18450 type:complete len:250 (-) Transcript_15210:400-1149(-)
MVYEIVCCGKATFSTSKQCGVCKTTYVETAPEAGWIAAHRNPVRKRPRNFLCVRLGQGKMAKDYSRNSILHVGISDNKGQVWHWNERGLTCDRFGWECIGCEVTPEEKLKVAVLEKAAQKAARFKTFTQNGFNCFAFAVAVLNSLELEVMNKKGPFTKTSLVEDAVANAVAEFEAWTTINSAIRESNKDYVVLDRAKAQQYTCDGCESTIDTQRWHCNDCEDFDLCNACHSDAPGNHDYSHSFTKMKDS